MAGMALRLWVLAGHRNLGVVAGWLHDGCGPE